MKIRTVLLSPWSRLPLLEQQSGPLSSAQAVTVVFHKIWINQTWNLKTKLASQRAFKPLRVQTVRGWLGWLASAEHRVPVTHKHIRTHRIHRCKACLYGEESGHRNPTCISFIFIDLMKTPKTHRRINKEIFKYNTVNTFTH